MTNTSLHLLEVNPLVSTGTVSLLFSLINFLLSNPIGNQLAVANKSRHLSVLNSEFGWPGRKVYPERTHPALSGIQLFCMNVGNGLVTCIAYVICVHTCLKSKPVAAKAKGKRAEFATNIAIELKNSQPSVCTQQWTSSLHPFCHTKHMLSL